MFRYITRIKHDKLEITKIKIKKNRFYYSKIKISKINFWNLEKTCKVDFLYLRVFHSHKKSCFFNSNDFGNKKKLIKRFVTCVSL